MTPVSANAELGEILHAHGVSFQEEDGWLRVKPGGPRLRAQLTPIGTDSNLCQTQLDVVVEPWTGRRVVESCGGFGETAGAAVKDALENFSRGSLHVFLSAFLRPVDEHVLVETWRVGGIDRKVIIGGVVSRGEDISPVDEEPWIETFEEAIKSLPLSSGTHWVRAYYCQQDGARLALEVLLDNAPWPALTARLNSHALNAGSSPKDLILAMPQIGLSREAMSQWSTYTPLVQRPAATPKPPPRAATAPPKAPKRPWWKFW